MDILMDQLKMVEEDTEYIINTKEMLEMSEIDRMYIYCVDTINKFVRHCSDINYLEPLQIHDTLQHALDNHTSWNTQHHLLHIAPNNQQAFGWVAGIHQVNHLFIDKLVQSMYKMSRKINDEYNIKI